MLNYALRSNTIKECLKWYYDQSTMIKNQNAVYRLQISALVPEIFKFEKWVKYANEMTDDVIHSTQ